MVTVGPDCLVLVIEIGTELIENKSSPKTTLDENETTLFENRLITSALDHINANSYGGIRRQP